MQIQIGQRIEIVYQDRSGKITQRIIDVNGIRNGRIRATCLRNGAPRVFYTIISWRGNRLIKEEQ